MFSHMPVTKWLLFLGQTLGRGGGWCKCRGQSVNRGLMWGDIDIMGGPNLLVKLAYAMQRLKKFLKRFCHAQQRWKGQVLDFVEGHHRGEGFPNQGNPARFGSTTEISCTDLMIFTFSCSFCSLAKLAIVCVFTGV